MTKPNTDFKRILKSSLRLYFAPLVGAYRQTCFELKRVDRDIRRSQGSKANP